MLQRLAQRINRRPRRVLAAAAVMFAVAAPIGITAFDALDPFRFEDPNTESAGARERLETASGIRSDADVIVLVQLDRGARSGPGRDEIRRVGRRLRSVEGIARVATPFRGGDASMISRDGRSAYVLGLVSVDTSEEEVTEHAEAAFAGDDAVTLGGSAVGTTQIGESTEKDLQRAELIAFPLLALLSVIFFRGLVASMIPLLVGGLTIVSSLFAMRLVHEAVPLTNTSINIVTALGFGLALDYGLFIVSRFREELARGRDTGAALETTLRKTGHAIAFSAFTVAAALAALLVFPQRFLVSMGVGGIIVTLLAAAVALTVLPALLAVLGPRVNALAPRRLQRARAQADLPDRDGRWYRLARAVMRRPVPVATASVVILLAAGAPFLRTEFVPADSSGVTEAGRAADEGPSSGRVARRLAADFPPPSTTPIIVQLDGDPADAKSPAMAAYVEQLRRIDDVTRVDGPAVVGDGALRVDVITSHAPISDAARVAVDDVRAVASPVPSSLTGLTADQIDEEESVAASLPTMLAIVTVTTLVMLFAMTGSVVLPFKVLAMNFLTVSVAFGLLVFVFQDGRLEGLLDYATQDGLQVAVPVLIFAIAFGLSTDYGVFSLSRIREARDAGASNEESVALGLERTGRLITAAALMFAVAMGALVSSNIIGVKEVGFGIAVSVLIDAFLIRVFLVPSLMGLLGDLNWWAPAPLRRLRTLGAELPVPSGSADVVALVRLDGPPGSAENRRHVRRVARKLRRLDGVVAVTTPYGRRGDESLLMPDRRSAFVIGRARAELPAHVAEAPAVVPQAVPAREPVT
jgi:RND superfamily putative drug exporter